VNLLLDGERPHSRDPDADLLRHVALHVTIDGLGQPSRTWSWRCCTRGLDAYRCCRRCLPQRGHLLSLWSPFDAPHDRRRFM